MSLKLDVRKLKLTVVTPMHIGGGEVFEPSNYLMNQKDPRGVGKLYEFDPVDFVKELSPKAREEFLKITEKENALPSIQSFFNRHSDIVMKISALSVLVCPSIASEHSIKLGQSVHRERDGTRIYNKLEIHRFIRSVNTLYIPGSSLKGSLKTPFYQEAFDINKSRIVSQLENIKGQRNDRQRENEQKDILAKLLGTFENDPFSKFKISDFIPVHKNSSIVLWGVNQPKKKRSVSAHQRQPLSVRYEVLIPDKTFLGECTLNRSELVSKSNEHFFQPFPKNWEEFIETVNKTYLIYARRELAWIEENPSGFLPVFHSKMKDYVRKAASGKGMLIKVGQHSGAEALTLEGGRQIKIPQIKHGPNIKDQSLTYWITSSESKSLVQAAFFGWVFLEETG